MGNLTFYSENNKEIILWNILAAEGIADNLLSLRKFADAGFGIFLDNKELRIFNKKTGEIHIRGVYREPNWIVTIYLSDKSKPQDSPMVTRQVKKLELKNPMKVKEMSQLFTGPYREVIGSLLYLAGVTRPDIAYAVNLLSRRQVAPTVGDFQEVKRILRY
uniref:Reverse transcriptase Ty1/copia-type domain-containing protein n=1 Tax=Trichogramma kaykai TaxID=54128 RepID=A0ABD2W0H7_9HYME